MNQHPVTQGMDLQYNIIDDLKKQRANISMFDLLKIYPIPRGSILSILATSSNNNFKRNQPSVPTVNNLDPWTSKAAAGFNDNIKTDADKDTLIGKNSKSTTPPFLLMFEIFNQNVHNWSIPELCQTLCPIRSVRS